jgi:predicted PurR-regulated permease PerM
MTTSVRESLQATSIAIMGLFVIASAAALYWLKPILLPLLLAAILAAVFRPIVIRLLRFGVPRPVSALLILGLLVVSSILAGANFVEPVRQWVSRVPTQIERVEREIRGLLEPVEKVAELTDKVDDLATRKDNPFTQVVRIDENSMSDRMLSAAREGAGHLALTLVLLFFVISYGHRIVGKFQRDLKHELLGEIVQNVSSYLFTITVINAGLGVAIGLTMWLLGMPSPVLWGVMGFILNFLPWLGAAVGIGLSAFVAMLTFEDVGHWLFAPAAYLILTSVEANFVTPIVLGNRFPINPLVLFVWILFWGMLWGVLGVLLAVPLLVAVRLIFAHFDRTEFIGELIGDRPRHYVRKRE